ncbi:putative selenium delivery protein YdfZ [Pectobacteriaceae bacterium C80]|nr:putative selenium delivery protein YdfZ [Pectobacteriaceae bacterium C80]
MYTAYDRYRNPLNPGCRVMQNGSHLVGTIAAIHDEKLKREEVRKAKCVELKNVDGYFAPEELMRLGETKPRLSGVVLSPDNHVFRHIFFLIIRNKSHRTPKTRIRNARTSRDSVGQSG